MDWFRMYHSTLDNPKVQQLSPEFFKTWVNLLCLASQTNGRKGTLPAEHAIAFRLRLALEVVQKQIALLIEAGLIDKADKNTLAIHDWNDFQYISDSSVERTRRWRHNKRHGDVTVTEENRTDSDPDTEQNRTDKKDLKKGGVGENKARSLAARADGSLAPSPESLDRQKQRLGMAPDQGLDYRSPPRTKSDNVLEPPLDRTHRQPASDGNGPRPIKSVSLSGEPQYE